MLHQFGGAVSDGGGPQGSLLVDGNTLYGMTRDGGVSNIGVIFKIDTDGNNYTILHVFTGGSSNGGEPIGSLLLSGGSLYGKTTIGGSSGFGVIFKIDTDGNNYTNIHAFTGTLYDGKYPYGGLILFSGALYGMTTDGGSMDQGVIFKLNTDGSGYTNLYNFTGPPNDGRDPFGNLTYHNSAFYGMTPFGGVNDHGTIFRMDTDGSNYTNLHSFHSSADGSDPRGSLLEISDYFYGFTSSGGVEQEGIVFEYTDIPEPVLFIIYYLSFIIYYRRKFKSQI